MKETYTCDGPLTRCFPWWKDTNPEDNHKKGFVGREEEAGSHDAAQRRAVMYSFCTPCMAHDIRLYAWLKTTLDRIPAPLINLHDELLPVKISTVEDLAEM